MENPERTAQYLAVLSDRRESLRTELARILPANGSVVLEIGCGHGHFLTAYSQAHPEAICLGIDIVKERVDRAQRKRNRARLSNLHFLLAEARLFLDVLPPKVELTVVFILFPDPWPKRRHQKHRLLQAEFLEKLAERAGEAARLYFRTDYGPYFSEAAAAIRENGSWQAIEEPWPFEAATVFQERADAYQSLVATKIHARSTVRQRATG